MTAGCDTAFGAIELRRYVMKPGRRDDLIALFEREFIEGQEACGMYPFGHFVDLDDAESFVWFRGFPDVRSRRSALEAFYDRSAAWSENRAAANDTMIDSDNVLLVRPARAQSGFDLRGLLRPNTDGASVAQSYVAVSIFMLAERPQEDAVAAFEREIVPELERVAHRIAYFVTEDSPNEYPRLPVREGEWALVAAGAGHSLRDLDRWREALQSNRLPEQLRSKIVGAEHLRLQPSRRSLLR